VSASGEATAIDFGAYPTGPCYKAGVDPAVLQKNIEDATLGSPEDFTTSTFLKKKTNQAEFKAWLKNNLDLRAVRKLDPKSRRERRQDDDNETLRNARLVKAIDDLSFSALEKLFFKTVVKFFADRDQSGDPSRRTLKRQKSYIARSSIGMFAPGSVIVLPLGTVDVSQGMTQEIAESLTKKFKNALNRALGFKASSVNADYAVFNAKNVDGALDYARSRECRTYVLFPSGLFKRFRLTDNCGTFAYRIFSRAIGRTGGLPLGLWNAPSTLLHKSTKRGSRHLLFTDKTRKKGYVEKPVDDESVGEKLSRLRNPD